VVSPCAAAPPLAGLKTPLLTGLVTTLLPVADRPRPEAQLLVHLLMAAPLLVAGSPEAAGPRSPCIVECLRLLRRAMQFCSDQRAKNRCAPMLEGAPPLAGLLPLAGRQIKPPSNAPPSQGAYNYSSSTPGAVAGFGA